MNNETSSLYKSVDELRSVHSSVNDALLAKLTSNATTVKRHYLAMEFNKINNHEFYDEKLYSLNTSIGKYRRSELYTPQINNISMQMPSTPILYRWHTIDQVQKIHIFLYLSENKSARSIELQSNESNT